MIKKHQYCFANISAMKARIFMKFYMVVNYYVVSLSFKFHEDPCTIACARVINARTRDKMCARKGQLSLLIGPVLAQAINPYFWSVSKRHPLYQPKAKRVVATV